MGEVFTAPLATISVEGTVIGKMKTVRVSETFRRGRVTGIGRVNAGELPVLEYTGTMNVSYYSIDFAKHPFFKEAILRETNTLDKFFNTLLLQEIGLKVDFFREVADKIAFPPEGRDDNGIIEKAPPEVFATVEEAFITSDGFDINEGQISGHDSAFEFTTGIHYLVPV